MHCIGAVLFRQGWNEQTQERGGVSPPDNGQFYGKISFKSLKYNGLQQCKHCRKVPNSTIKNQKDNRVTEETDWDKWKLRSEFSELFSDGDYFTGFTPDEISKIMSMDLGFRNQSEMSDEMPTMLFPVEIACNESQWSTFQEVQSKMKKKNQIDIVMELCKMFLSKE